MNQDFFIVGIGASAGGESSLYDFFANVSPQINAAFIVVRHLKRDYRSQMKFLLSRHTRMPIFTIRNGEEIKRGHVYLLPENATVTIRDGYLFLKERLKNFEPNWAINEFFKSLATEASDRAIGIVLSGMGTDGTQGASIIEKNGGIVIAENLESAEFNSMPQNVITQDCPDYILPARAMGAHLLEYIKSRQIINTQ